jgi:hypothetical protein
MKNGKLDEYAMKARVFPAFIALAPLGTLAGQFVGLKSLFLAVCTGIGGTAILSFVLAQWSRDAGKRKESELFDIWEGKPTTRYLRHRNLDENPVLRLRRRQRLEKLAQGIVLPSIAAEDADPAEADHHYEAATKVLIQRTRDKARFAVLFQELIDYGFRRNMWGLKTTAIIVDSTSLLLCVLLVLFGQRAEYNVTLAITFVVILAGWCLVVTPSWVYRSARTYSERLFDTLDEMSELDETSAAPSIQVYRS